MPAFPPKTNYAAGDVLTAAQMNDVGNALSAYQFTVGKNKIINGDFRVNQRNFTSNTANNSYNFDRWVQLQSGGTVTVTPQTFTAGAAPVAGYEGINFVRVDTASQSTQSHYSFLSQRIEDVRTLANQTATVSFWAKAGSGTPYVWVEYQQNFGSGGSGTVIEQVGASQQISTTWTRYSFTVGIDSISGKTIGTSNYLAINIFTSLGSSIRGYANATFQNATIDIWGVQVEAGSTATPFTTATGTLAGELALAQRYYTRFTSGQNAGRLGSATGAFTSTTNAFLTVPFPVTMRAGATALDFSGSGLGLWDFNTDIAVTNLALTANCQNQFQGFLTATVASGGTQYRPVQLEAILSTTAFVGFSAEL